MKILLSYPRKIRHFGHLTRPGTRDVAGTVTDPKSEESNKMAFSIGVP